ncbi:MAG TPA: hypothetical protein G4O11_07950, partial [Anaerolineae bacterium]|nr:hypothetical protein [Anaerolineae bacterium]
MPITPTYPGVYIEEVPSGVRPITGVSTSVAAFIDYFKRGPMNNPVQIFNMGDFEREFGGLDTNSEASYAIQQFFLNGGREAWVVRVASGSCRKATVEILDGIEGTKAFTVEAISEGSWGNALRVSVDYNTSNPTSLFNLGVSEYVSDNGVARMARSEIFRNLSMDPPHPGYIETVVNDETSGSKLIRVSATGTNRPLQNGTTSGDLSIFPGLSGSSPAVNVTIGTEGTFTANFGEKPTDLAKARSVLEAAIRSAKPDNPAFSSARVEVLQNRLRIFTGPAKANYRPTFTPGDDPTLSELKLDTRSILAFEGIISGDLSTFPTLSSATPAVDVTIGAEGPHTATFASKPTTIDEARTELENVIRAPHTSPAFTGARVAIDETKKHLIVVAGTPAAAVSFTVPSADATTVTELKLDAVSSLSAMGIVSGDLSTFPTLSSPAPAVDVTIGSEGPYTATLDPKPRTIDEARTELEKAIRAAHTSLSFTGARVATDETKKHLIVVAGTPAAAITLKAATDTTTVTELKIDAVSALSAMGIVSGDLSTFPTLSSATPAVDVTIGSEGPHTAKFTSKPTNLDDARTELENAIRAAHTSPAFTGARVATDETKKHLIVVAGTPAAAVSFTASSGDVATVRELKLDTASVSSVMSVASGDLSTFPTLTSKAPVIDVTIGTEGPHTATFSSKPTTIDEARTELQKAIRAAHTSSFF